MQYRYKGKYQDVKGYYQSSMEVMSIVRENRNVDVRVDVVKCAGYKIEYLSPSKNGDIYESNGTYIMQIASSHGYKRAPHVILHDNVAMRLKKIDKIRNKLRK